MYIYCSSSRADGRKAAVEKNSEALRGEEYSKKRKEESEQAEIKKSKQQSAIYMRRSGKEKGIVMSLASFFVSIVLRFRSSPVGLFSS